MEEAARLWCRSGLLYAGVDLRADISSDYVNGSPAEVSATHMYLTGGGLPSLSTAGYPRIGFEVYIWGGVGSVVAGMGRVLEDDILRLGKVEWVGPK